MSRLKVLVLDANRQIYEVVESVLRDVGVTEIAWARTPEQALTEMDERAFDLLLLEENLRGGLAGTEVARRIRSDPRNASRTIPIIMMTTSTGERIVTSARDAGITDVIAKPFSRGTLLRRIEHVLGQPSRFVRSSAYFGPDRRRRSDQAYSGPERRSRPGGAAEPQAARSAAPKPPQPAPAASTALVVDDEPVNRSVLAAMLRKLGLQAMEAGDSGAALELVRAQPFDHLFVDIHMPGKHGVDLVQTIRETPGPNQDAPIIACTADATLSGEALAPVGFDGYISKPISLTTVRAALQVARRPFELLLAEA